MNYADWSPKLALVLKETDKDSLFHFMCSYAEAHEELAMALITEFWQTAPDDYRSMVQQCLMHPASIGLRTGESFDWAAIARDLSGMMNLADQKKAGGSLLDAVEISRWVMVLTCDEYEKDHPYGEQLGEMWWLRRKLLCETMDRAKNLLTELLINGDDIDEESQRGLMKEIVAVCKPFKKPHICDMETFLEDAQEKVLTPKRYLTWLSKKVETIRGGHFKVPYIRKKALFLNKNGRRDEAIDTLLEGIGDDDPRMLCVDLLIEWKEYQKALGVTDIPQEDSVYFMSNYGEKAILILDFIGDRQLTVSVLKDRFRRYMWKGVFFNRLHEVLSQAEWNQFLDETIADADSIFTHDYDTIEAKIYMERKLYDHLVRFCIRNSYNAEENMEKYARYMSAEDQRLVAEDITRRMKARAPECRRSKDYEHFAAWVKRLSDSSPVCKEIAHKVMDDVQKENPGRSFAWAFKNVGL
mgnify:CR=1 FL=1